MCWSGIRESDPCLILGKDTYYHCTNPALFVYLPEYDILVFMSTSIYFFVQ